VCDCLNVYIDDNELNGKKKKQLIGYALPPQFGQLITMTPAERNGRCRATPAAAGDVSSLSVDNLLEKSSSHSTSSSSGAVKKGSGIIGQKRLGHDLMSLCQLF